MAVAAMKALHDGGSQVPDDCSVVAIDGIDMSNYTIPTLTTLVQPQEEMGDQAVQLLVNLIERPAENRQLSVRTTLRMGESVRSL
jgi:LacI family transcriptional regulator